MDKKLITGFFNGEESDFTCVYAGECLFIDLGKGLANGDVITLVIRD